MSKFLRTISIYTKNEADDQDDKSSRLRKISALCRKLLIPFSALILMLMLSSTLRAQSTDATLSALTISDGTLSPNFDPGTLSYQDHVPANTPTVTVTPTANDPNATITVNGSTVASGTPSGTIALGPGSTLITIVVTAQDGTTQNTYTINVLHPGADVATLSNFTISSGILTPTFNTATTAYTDTVSFGVPNITVTPTVTNSNSTVTVNGTAVASGSASQNIPLNPGDNTINVVVTAADGSTTVTYTITVTRSAASSVATLSNLAISAGTLNPTFNSGTNAYTDAVPFATSSVTVTPTVTDPNSTVTVNGTTVASGNASSAIQLNVGSNTITVVVTAQDGTTGTYTITVTRAAASTVATLSNLTISAGALTPPFDPAVLTYTDNVPASTTNLTVTPTAGDPNETIKVNGTTVASGTPSGPISISPGSTTITIVVTAEDNSTTKTYTITVNEPSTVATLSNLTVSSGTLTPTFSSGTTTYTDAVSNATTSVTVTPTVADTTATVSVNGTPVTSGTASPSIPLNPGPNTITVVVTAQDGTTRRTYNINVTRANSAVATLSDLTVSVGTLTPTFSSGTTSYTDAVPNATTSIAVTPTASDPNSTITVNGTPVTSGSPSAAIPLTVGANTITVVVTAQDGTTKGTYTITVNRAPSSTALLSALTVSAGTLSPAFTSGNTSYADTVSNNTTTIRVRPSTGDPNATIKVNGTTVGSGRQSAPITLVIGPNVIDIVVTAQDGVTTATYRVTVVRSASANAALSNLRISSGTLTPAFSSGTFIYAAGVSNATTSITVTPTATDPNATIRVNGTTVASGSTSPPIALQIGINVIVITVTAQDGVTSNTYSLTVTRAPSSAASLSNLTVSAGTLSPAFSSGVSSYTVQVPNAVSSITVTPTTTDPAARVTVNGTPVTSGTASGPIPLQFGPNLITITVTAQDGITTGTYTVTVIRTPSAAATLSNLTLSTGTLAPVFTSGTTSYAASVSNATSSVTVTPTATDPASTITVNGIPVTSGTASQPIPLQVGSNLITIVVTAQDGITKNTYTINVSRTQPSPVTLSNLTISTGSLAPVFNSQTFSYASAVGSTTTSLTVTATTSDPTATLTVNGVPVGSGTPSAPIDLQVGANEITVQVISQSGLVTTYTITVARAASTNALLSNLVLSDGTLSPAFNSNITNYTASVDNTVNEITVIPTAADPTSTIKVNGITVNSGTASGPINLSSDNNTITIVVTAADGTTTQTYTVIVHKNGVTTSVVVSNLLTPNGDGKNDVWIVKNIALYPNNMVTVYDHSGRVIFTRKGYANDWSGTYNGAPLNEDTYYYYIDLGPGESKLKGFITVLKRR